MANTRRLRSSTRRALAAGLLLAPARTLWAATPTAPAAASAPREATVEVWVQLSLPELARVPADQRVDASSRIAQQQDEVMSRLRALGAVEQARVQVARNAIAVRLPGSALPQARAIDGVRAVTPVRHRDLHRP